MFYVVSHKDNRAKSVSEGDILMLRYIKKIRNFLVVFSPVIKS